MTWRLIRDKLPQLLSALFCLLFSAVLLSALSVPPAAVAFLSLVWLLGALLPIAAELVRRRRFYADALSILEELEDKYLFCEFLQPPEFADGVIFCQAMAQVGKSMSDHVAVARRDMAEYREYIEAWVHEVKTPIASARLLLENHPGGLSDRFVTELFDIECYVEQALFYARSGAVERDYIIKEVPLRQMTASAVKLYARALIGSGFQIHLDGLSAKVYTDPKWVEFILGQLISNAVKYRTDTPSLTFTQQVRGASVILALEDNGVGIPARDLPRVFEKGFTGSNGRQAATRSTGLGLYLCKKLCERLSLSISVEPAQGQGTRVCITFPKSRFYLAG